MSTHTAIQGLVTQNVELLTKQSLKPTLGYTGFLNKRGRLINQGFLAPLNESCEDWLVDVHPATGSGKCLTLCIGGLCVFSAKI